MEIIIFITIFIVIFWIFLVFKFSKKRKLDRNKIIFFENRLESIKKYSFKEQIMDYDKLYHKILLELWYKWTFWEILKSKPKIIIDIQKIWELHKLRNKLAHELDIVDEKILYKNSLEYYNEIKKILNNIS